MKCGCSLFIQFNVADGERQVRRVPKEKGKNVENNDKVDL